MKSKLIKTAIVVLLFSILIGIHAEAPHNFRQAKKIAVQLFAQHPYTLYCGCAYHLNQIDLTSCGMQSAAYIKSSHQLQWEHLVPAEMLGRSFPCWQEPLCTRKNGKPYKGRACCEKISPEFRMREAELFNLWPSVGLVNQARSNYPYTSFGAPLTAEFYGCPIRIDKILRKVEPRDEAKGIGARASLFMSQRYDMPLSAAQTALFETWDKQYPPSAWEKAWSHQVADIEGYANPFIQ